MENGLPLPLSNCGSSTGRGWEAFCSFAETKEDYGHRRQLGWSSTFEPWLTLTSSAPAAVPT